MKKLAHVMIKKFVSQAQWHACIWVSALWEAEAGALQLPAYPVKFNNLERTYFKINNEVARDITHGKGPELNLQYQQMDV